MTQYLMNKTRLLRCLSLVCHRTSYRGRRGLHGLIGARVSRAKDLERAAELSPQPKQLMVTALVAMVTVLCSWDSDDAGTPPSCLGSVQQASCAAGGSAGRAPWGGAGEVLMGGWGLGSP